VKLTLKCATNPAPVLRFRHALRYRGQMKYWQKCFDTRLRFRPAVALILTLALLDASTLSADARGGHGSNHAFAGGGGPHGVQLASGHRHGNDAHIKAATEERDRLLNTQIKSICRGC
jgi:hypothetical protein